MSPSSRPAKTGSYLGRLAGLLLKFFGKSPKLTQKNLDNIEFSTSTQRMGIGFNERIRAFFRLKWLKKRN